MSINSLQSSPWSNPWDATQSSVGAPGSAASSGPFAEITQIEASFGTTGPAASWSGQNVAGTNGTSASPANPLQSLASDIQAMLIQAQNGAASGGGTAGTATPEQNVATDLQSLLGSIQPGTAANAQTADTNPTAPSGETEHHHHHHHHDGGGEATGATDVADTSTTATQTSGDQSVATNLASDIAQAIQAYAGGGPAAAVSMLTA